MAEPRVGWSLGKAPDLIIEVWSTTALVEAVIAALLEDPEKLDLALKALRGSGPPGGHDTAGRDGDG